MKYWLKRANLASDCPLKKSTCKLSFIINGHIFTNYIFIYAISDPRDFFLPLMKNELQMDYRNLLKKACK